MSLKGSKLTNIVAEIIAVIEACKICMRHDINSIEIITDSQYVISCIETYIEKWKNNGWLNAKHKPVANQELFKKLDQLRNLIDVKFKFVPGHQGILGNEEADKLARIGSDIYQPRKEKLNRYQDHMNTNSPTNFRINRIKEGHSYNHRKIPGKAENGPQTENATTIYSHDHRMDY